MQWDQEKKRAIELPPGPRDSALGGKYRYAWDAQIIRARRGNSYTEQIGAQWTAREIAQEYENDLHLEAYQKKKRALCAETRCPGCHCEVRKCPL